MRRSLIAFVSIFVLAALTIPATAPAQTPASRHIILISIDGFHPDMYLDSTWPAPNLRQLMKLGVYAKHLKSVFPSYTYPSHTAMLTGALPARSGIFFNQPRGSHGEWNWFAKDIKVPTLWQACKQAGLATAAVEWPVSVTNEITWNLPEIWDPELPRRPHHRRPPIRHARFGQRPRTVCDRRTRQQQHARRFLQPR